MGYKSGLMKFYGTEEQVSRFLALYGTIGGQKLAGETRKKSSS